MCGCTYVILRTCIFSVVSGKIINLSNKLFSTWKNVIFFIFKNDLQVRIFFFYSNRDKKHIPIYIFILQVVHSLLVKILKKLISGNILLNISLSPSIPLKRQGTNNVYMMCVPNPKISPKDEENKPAAMLVRVKNAEAADELLEKMEDLRKE